MKYFLYLLIYLLCTRCNSIVQQAPLQENVDVVVYQNKPLILTRHAECRMDCRQISLEEVQYIIDNGRINPRKSKPAPSPDKCPTKAYEAWSPEGQKIRLIIGICPDEPILITAIDLGHKHQCNCD